MPPKPDIKIQLIQLFEEWVSEKAKSIDTVHAAGSERKYFRIKSDNKIAIGVFNFDHAENEAFISFSKTFSRLNFNTPKIFAKELNKHIYLIEDLGSKDLFSRVIKEGQKLSEATIAIYKKSLKALLNFQTQAVDLIDFSKCTPRNKLDQQSLLWDLNYFKYYFLKTQKISFDEQLLENDFKTFTNYLLEADQKYFVYRDFQSRNILIQHDEPFFIDYQGARKGPLQYDVASLLFQVKANLSNEVKKELLDYYIGLLNSNDTINTASFKKYYHPYALIRLCQVLGAYGFRGLIEKKPHFIQSIPFAIKSLKNLLPEIKMEIEIPELMKVLKAVSNLQFPQVNQSRDGLTVHLKSFAYKAGIPNDFSGHGEGFVFDCRSLPNPGRLKEYKHLSGLNQEVIDYLDNFVEIDSFLKNVINIIKPAVTKFQQRNFTDLSINFGCTGGQHRSVYMTEAINKFLITNFKVNIELEHTQKTNWPMSN